MAARRRGVRERNLGEILRLVHEHGPRSRATLTADTGLNRSTVGDLVTALVDADLVVEADSAPQGVGRPSPIVSVSPRVAAVAANPEVDALTLGVVGLDQRMIVRERIPVPALLTPERTAALIAERVAAWRRGMLRGIRLAGVGVAVPGPVRAVDGLVRAAPHLGWVDVPLPEIVAARTGMRCVVGNDANMGARAENLFGAARGARDVVYVNGGASGIGGGIILNGMPVGGASGYAGEFGQSRPATDDPADRLSPAGTLEDEVSRARLVATVTAARMAPAGADLTDDAVLAASLTAGGDAAVDAEVARQRRILATALANAANVLNPSVIVVGGFLAVLAETDHSGLEALVQAQTMPAVEGPIPVRPATLAGDRLLIGAAEAVFAHLVADPLAARTR